MCAFIAFESRGAAVDNITCWHRDSRQQLVPFSYKAICPSWIWLTEKSRTQSHVSPQLGEEKKMQFRFQHFCNPSEPPIKFALLCGKGLKILWAPKHSIQKLSTSAWFVVRQQLKCIACHITQSSEFSLTSNTCWQLKISVGNTCHSCVWPLY